MKVPLYRQLDSNDCGPVCIQMIAAYYNRKYSLVAIKGFCEVTRIGVSVRDLVSCGSRLGLKMIPVRVNISEARRIPTPAILYMKKGHFVVLDNVRHSKKGYVYHIIDPGYGRVKMYEENLHDCWMSNGGGVAVVVAPVENFVISDTVAKVEKGIGYQRVYEEIGKIVLRYKRTFGWVALLTLFVVVTNWAMPLLLKTTIDDGIIGKNINVVWTMLCGQFLFFLGFMFAGNVSNLLATKASLAMNIDFVATYFKKIIRLPMSYFDVGLRTDLIQKMVDLERLGSFITGNMLSVLFTLMNIIVFSILLLNYSNEVFLMFIAFRLYLSSTIASFFQKGNTLTMQVLRLIQN